MDVPLRFPANSGKIAPVVSLDHLSEEHVPRQPHFWVGAAHPHWRIARPEARAMRPTMIAGCRETAAGEEPQWPTGIVSLNP